MNEQSITLPGSQETASPLIRVENVSKRFVIGAGRAGDLRERFQTLLPRRRQPEAAPSEFWAFRDVSFTLGRGETLGIIGHNGSGKSTLLKILTGILQPTTGTVDIRGRVGALIEVGAGFHPDLTGRENIFLNGSILGLSRKDIGDRFQQIVAFAGLETFIDTPVKRYSSGMYMRLGFSIAAHTDPDILIVDEVLAVGDALFQAKCFRHLKKFIAQGGTVIFVSHAAAQVRELCEKCVWLDHGTMRFVGPTSEAVDQYMSMVAEREEAEFKRLYYADWEAREAERQRLADDELLKETVTEPVPEEPTPRKHRPGDDGPPVGRIVGVTLQDAEGVERNAFRVGEPLRVLVSYAFERSLPNPIFGIDFLRDDGTHIFTTSNYDHELSLANLPLQGELMVDIDFLSLAHGDYRIRVNLFADCQEPDWWEYPEDEANEAARFSVNAGRFANGQVYLPTRWIVGGAALPSPLLQPNEAH